MTSQKTDYRMLTAELEQLVNKLQSGELGIDEAAKAYEQGMKLVKQLETYLETAENQISELQAKQTD